MGHSQRVGEATIYDIYSPPLLRFPRHPRALARALLRASIHLITNSRKGSKTGNMWHWSAVSSEIIRLRTQLFLIYTAIAIAGASEELTQRSCHQLREIPPALSNWGREKIHLDKHTYFANPGENELLFPARMNEHEEHAAVGGATTGY
ncbi:hypothetical protein PSHT_11371 [Puccinia striiformis]|uniref:Uncharacterized protein n=1 Tax=Puccinia striiformis TaxID=27350 RepID=A0A2S4V3R5_9BASI|nr:hypothetical protein PSHT_11371 [Puccinia striiformis]